MEPDDRSGGPGRVFDVTRFGARGDGVTIDTDAINRAIEVAAAGGAGGTVYFPAGTYACYSIRLKSNVALYLAQNATILGAAPAGGRGDAVPVQGGLGMSQRTGRRARGNGPQMGRLVGHLV